MYRYDGSASQSNLNQNTHKKLICNDLQYLEICVLYLKLNFSTEYIKYKS